MKSVDGPYRSVTGSMRMFDTFATERTFLQKYGPVRVGKIEIGLVIILEGDDLAHPYVFTKSLSTSRNREIVRYREMPRDRDRIGQFVDHI